MPELSDHMANMLAPQEDPDAHFMLTRRHRLISTALRVMAVGPQEDPERWREQAQELVDVTASDADQERYARCKTDEDRAALLQGFHMHVAGLYEAGT